MIASLCIWQTPARRCFCRSLLALLLVLGISFPDAVSAATVVKVWGAPAAALHALRNAQPGIVWLSASTEAQAAQPQLQVAWQQDAYQQALATGSRAPILLLNHQRLPASRLRNQDAALIWGPPLALQVQLTRRLMPLAKRIGVLYRATSPAEMTALSATPAASGVQLVPLLVEAPLTARALAEAADLVDVFIASNDDALFNRDSAKLILLTAYHHKRPVIGPTPAFVSAGAVATEAVPKAALILAIVARIEHWQSSGSLGDDHLINHFAPVFNAQVARSLNLVIPADLRREVQP